MLSRRSFLASAAAASAAPLIWPRNAKAAPSDKLTLGFIGVGTQGRSHLNGFLGRDAVEVVAVCDVVQERTDSAAEMVEKKYAERKKSPALSTSRTTGRLCSPSKSLDSRTAGASCC